jgi:chromate transport protein ChrA
MAGPIHRRITRWIIDNLLWDTSGTAREGLWGGLWATRKLLIALAGAALLTWWEWMMHHPPEIALVEVIHFVFVLAVVALVVHVGRQFSRNDTTLPSTQPKD